MWKEPTIVKIIKVVVVAAVVFLIFALISRPSKKMKPWVEELIHKYSLEYEKDESYYEGFKDAIDYVYDHLEELNLYRW